ncbi:Cytochrome b subunit of the bc complex [hydrothermal vent metagenome]|uniref:Cytochrome b subunit of the bc complex n=1 Tax=hydrothermal vent metagenome TaxID=652676 RepID=A0A3B0TNY1_9ZZZZ
MSVKSVLRRGFSAAERGCDRIFSPALNPLAQLGALGYFLFWIVAASGIYLFIFFDTGVVNAYASLEWISNDLWYHAGIMRSFHRYASDLMVVVVVLHLLREFALDRYRGVRWFSWLIAVPIIWLLYISGITGYWLVWDQLAQFVAIVSSELLDWLPIFGEPIARNFLTPESLSGRFFTLMVFLHIAIPMLLLVMMWVHITRISRPKVNPPRPLMYMILLALLATSLWRPALSQGPADLSKVVTEVGIDWYLLPLYPLADLWSAGAIWALIGGFTLLVLFMPWLPPMKRPRAAVVDLEHCNGCARCVEDCPYEAIRLVPRSDALPFPQEVVVDPDLCVGCGICMGACPSSTPFRHSDDYATGIDLPDLPLKALREKTIAAAATLKGPARVLVLACEHGGASEGRDGFVSLPCVAMAPPSLIDFILSRDMADGVVIAGCAERSCYNRLGVEWTKARVAGKRDPYLRDRVPRERLTMIWADGNERRRFDAELAAFAKKLAELPQAKPPMGRAAPTRQPDKHTGERV